MIGCPELNNCPNCNSNKLYRISKNDKIIYDSEGFIIGCNSEKRFYYVACSDCNIKGPISWIDDYDCCVKWNEMENVQLNLIEFMGIKE